MTEPEIAALGPAFATYLRRFRRCFRQDRTAGHFDTYCRGLLTDLPRKSVEPIALAAGTAVRTLREFLTTPRWDHAAARDALQAHLRDVLAGLPADPLGTVGVIDEASCRKWGDHTPGVQRQYLGCVGEGDHGIVTAHVAVTRGTFQALADADLYLPEAWDADRPRCRAARIGPPQCGQVVRSGVRARVMVGSADFAVLGTGSPPGTPQRLCRTRVPSQSRLPA